MNKETGKIEAGENLKIWYIMDEEDNGRGCGSEQLTWFSDKPPADEDPVSIVWCGNVSRKLGEMLLENKINDVVVEFLKALEV